MKILNIHDYHEDKNNTAYRALQACEFEIINQQYDYDGMDPFPLFDLICAHFLRNFCDIVVGTGIGAFFAICISAKYQVPCVLINPTVVPGMYLLDAGYNRFVGVPHLCDLECKYLREFNLCGTSTIIDDQWEYMNKSLLNYTKELLDNPRYYELSNSTEPQIIELFKQHKKEWFDDTYATDLA